MKKKGMENMMKGIKMGSPEDFTNFFNAVIDETAGTESGRIKSLNPQAAKKK